ncbi:hypothetical protein GOARA_029_00235, partial [Gordonia araii NBRC 100433]
IAAELESMCTAYNHGLRSCRTAVDEAYNSTMAGHDDDDDDQLRKAAAKIRTIISSFEGTLTAYAASGQKVTSDSETAKRFLEPIASRSPVPADFEHEDSERGREGEAAMTAEQIREVINTLRKGKNRGVYVAPSEEEIQSLYDRLSRGGVPDLARISVHPGVRPGLLLDLR